MNVAFDLTSATTYLPHTFACSTLDPAGLNLRRFAGVSEAGARGRNPERSLRGIFSFQEAERRYHPSMRVYKFLNKQFGLKGLYERRLKQSRIHELNDPFELAPYDLTKPAVRHAFLSLREVFGQENGLVCFSASWQNPVIWAHYADKHQGICLGFEIPPITGDGGKDIAKKVTYISRPLHFPSEFLSLPQARQLRYANRIPFTKFNHWAYEKEIRVWGRLSNEEDGLHFFVFEKRMRLVEVRVGASCTLPRSAITRTLGASASETRIIKVRAAHNRFAMVQDGGW